MSKPILHAIALLGGARQYLRDSGDHILSGLAHSLERAANESIKDTPRAATRRSVQSQGLSIALESADRWIDRHPNPTRAEIIALVSASFRHGVETGADAILADQLSDADHTAIHQGRPDSRLHSYTVDQAGTLVRLDNPQPATNNPQLPHTHS